MVGQPFVLKTTPPRMPRSAFARPRLTRIWQDLDGRSATLVEAPRGFGKTTLLAQWRRLWLEQGALVAWITLDSEDDPARLTQALLLAMRTASGRSVFDTLAAQYRAGLSDGLESLTAALSEIANLATPTVLILDDVEQLPVETVEQSLAYLLLNAPANLQIVIGARSAIPLPTAELLARDAMRRLTVRELRLDLDESVAILRDRFRTRLTLDECVKLHEITEGWPIGLQLVAAAIERDDDLSRAVQSLSGRHGDIERYFVETLFDRLPDEQRNFLVRIAILDYLTPELCEHVTGCASAAMFIDQLMSDTPFLIVAELRGWIRLHALARDFLLSRLEALPVGERRQLHERAAAWFARAGFFHEAGEHALAAGDQALARSCAEQSIWDLAKMGRLGEARQWLRHLPPAMAEGDAALRISSAWVMALGDRPQEALKVAEKMAAEQGHDHQSRFLIALVYTCAAGFCDKPGLIQAALEPWIDSPVELSEPAYAMAYSNTLAAAALFRGDTQESRRVIASAPGFEGVASIELARAIRQILTAVGHLWDGNAFKAESCVQLPMLQAERAMGRRSVPASILAAALAAAVLERGDDENAQALLADRLDTIERAGLTDAILLAYRALAILAWRRGDERRALEVLDNLRTLGAARGVPRMVMTSLAEQVRVHALAARPETARERLLTLESMRAAFRRAEFAPFLPLYDLNVAISRSYAALAAGEVGVANEALKRADALATKYARGRDAIVIKALRAVAAAEHGHADRASALLKEAAGLASIGGMSNLLGDTHPRAAALIRADAQPIRVEAKSSPAPAIASLGAVVVGGLLTPKEAKILGLLSANMSNKVIARTMDVSDETVKWHLKNLFSKLNAGTRKHAVDRARLLGLFSA